MAFAALRAATVMPPCSTTRFRVNRWQRLRRYSRWPRLSVSATGERFASQCREDIIEDDVVVGIILGQSHVDRRHGWLLHARRRRRQAKFSWSESNTVLDAALGSLGSGIDAVAHRTALHEDDGMVAILARDRCRQTKNMPGLGATGGKFEADGRQVMALVDDDVTIRPD
jgi:hypothetical protein